MQIFQDIFCHLFIIILYLRLLIKQCCRTIFHRMKQISTSPVKNWHKIVCYNLNTKLCKIAQSCFIIFNILITCRKPYLNIIMHIYTFYYVHIKASTLNLTACFFYLINFPYFSSLLIVQCPYNSCHTWNLLNLLKCDAVIAFTIPAECHLHK